MDSKEFIFFRNKMKKTQKEMARLLGISIKAIHSYEQGWRNVPVHVERQLLFLVSRITERDEDARPCWEVNGCPFERRERCPAWEFKAGRLCWFVNGTICSGVALKTWSEKMKLCRACKTFKDLLPSPPER